MKLLREIAAAAVQPLSPPLLRRAHLLYPGLTPHRLYTHDSHERRVMACIKRRRRRVLSAALSREPEQSVGARIQKNSTSVFQQVPTNRVRRVRWTSIFMYASD